MQKTIDSINLTLEMLQNYVDSLGANKNHGENQKIQEQKLFNLTKRFNGVVFHKKRSAFSRFKLMPK
jgi:hypothetical protein